MQISFASLYLRKRRSGELVFVDVLSLQLKFFSIAVGEKVAPFQELQRRPLPAVYCVHIIKSLSQLNVISEQQPIGCDNTFAIIYHLKTKFDALQPSIIHAICLICTFARLIKNRVRDYHLIMTLNLTQQTHNLLLHFKRMLKLHN